MALPDGAEAALVDTPERVIAFLTAHSGLPGPRSNLELLALAGELLAPELAARLRTDTDEYLRCCGVIHLARTWLRAGDAARAEASSELVRFSADESWRVRESVAMALQRIGDDQPDAALAMALDWSKGPDVLLARAGIAGICEPRLLGTPVMAAGALAACGNATGLLAMEPASRRREPSVRTLRQALGYCWSVAVAADPAGLAIFLALDTSDVDVAWVVRQNHSKARLKRVLLAG